MQTITAKSRKYYLYVEEKEPKIDVFLTAFLIYPKLFRKFIIYLFGTEQVYSCAAVPQAVR